MFCLSHVVDHTIRTSKHSTRVNTSALMFQGTPERSVHLPTRGTCWNRMDALSMSWAPLWGIQEWRPKRQCCNHLPTWLTSSPLRALDFRTNMLESYARSHSGRRQKPWRRPCRSHSQEIRLWSIERFWSYALESSQGKQGQQQKHSSPHTRQSPENCQYSSKLVHKSEGHMAWKGQNCLAG